VDLAVRYRHDDDPTVALLAEVLVAELVSARWWLAS
jgi:glucosamine--fructose-6-phosphate aminotransferase (isomerizing)